MKMELLNGGTYKVDARNFGFAVYRAKDRAFIGIRYKFGDRFLDAEYDYDTGAPHGTCTPLEFLGMCPVMDIDTENPALFDYLDILVQKEQPKIDAEDEKRRNEIRQTLKQKGLL